jgi:predicted phosphodiesterase
MNTSDFEISKNSLSNFNPNFTVLLGDNFYDYGVSSVNDPLWTLFDSLSHTAPVFYAVLGNHDYEGSIDAQAAYSRTNNLWVMPSRYFYKLIPFNNQIICAIFIDSFQLDQVQINWLESVLASAACQLDSAFRMVFTHYPIHTVGVFFGDHRVALLYRDVKPMLEKFRVHAYICGHEHDMEAFLDNGVAYLTAGSFSDNYGSGFNYTSDSKLIFRRTDTPGYLVFDSVDNQTLAYRFINSKTNRSIYENSISTAPRLGPEVEIAKSGAAHKVRIFVVCFVIVFQSQLF